MKGSGLPPNQVNRGKSGNFRENEVFLKNQGKSGKL